MSYIAIAAIMLGVSYLLIEMGFKLDFSFLKEHNLSSLQYFIYIIAGWLCLATTNVAVKINNDLSYNLDLTIGVYYKALLWVMIIVTISWLLIALFQGFKYFYEAVK